VQAVYDQQLQRAASTSTSSSLVGNLSAGVTEPKSIMARIFNGQAIVRYMVGLNSGQGPGGTTNPLIGMKNLGDRILDAGWGALGAYVGIRAIDGGAQKALSGWAGKTLDVATGGVAGALSGAASGVLSALTPFVVMILTALFFFGAMLSIYIPMLPFMAQGAAQAIEDGAALAACLAGTPDVEAAFRRYEAVRLPRASKIQSLSAQNKVRFHLPDGPEQEERDRRMATRSTDWSIEAVAWIYGHDAGIVDDAAD